MKLVLMILALAAVALAAPIQVAGSGTFDFDRLDSTNDWTISFDGSSGTASVGLTFTGFGPSAGSPASGSICGNTFNGNSPLGAFIDGQHFSNGFYSFCLGGGDGSITGFDASHNPVITEEIGAYLVVTSEICTGLSPSFPVCSGTFAATTPEPSTWLLITTGLGLLGWRRLGTQN